MDGDFNFPRGLASTVDGEIIIADTNNHRVQIINQQGIFVKKFGTKGANDGQMNEPTGVTELPNGDIAVADRKNKRVQVFGRPKRQFKFLFPTVHEPFAIASDRNFNIVVSTMNRHIEVYNRAGKLRHVFPVEGGAVRGKIGMQICLNDKDEVLVLDSANGFVKYYSYDGKLLYKFKPLAAGPGLTMMPSAMCLTPLCEVVIADALNHTVSVYSERGALLKQLLGPTDNAGPIQACAIGPEGHMITTEFSLSGPHCLKVFRYLPCYCHLTRPGSSKRRTPTPILKNLNV